MSPEQTQYASLFHALDLCAALLPEAVKHPDRPTPCDDFTVAGLTGHMYAVVLRLTELGEGKTAEGYLPPASTDDLVGSWNSAQRSAHKLWAELAPETTIVVPWGESSAGAAAGVYTSEFVQHGWDLAVATGQSFAPADALVEYSFEALKGMIPVANRDEMWAEIAAQVPPGVPWEPPCANAVPIADDAPVLDRLIAWSGRDPQWAPSS